MRVIHIPMTDFDISTLTPVEKELLDLVLGYGGEANPRSCGTATEEGYQTNRFCMSITAEMQKAMVRLKDAGFVYVRIDRFPEEEVLKPSPEMNEFLGYQRVADLNGRHFWIKPLEYHMVVAASDEFLAWMQSTCTRREQVVR